ncbi:MAG: hypothetical protein HY730_02615 [Candidatus Tectomicrobia bacterium]|uniref:Alkyl hydroperoxide reductase subunit C/ Thiol specific antioxidant domain-containing protein n=1 Tax=Tectimicrobiota bacterium TaxID=2528274 RepID=A0A933GJZ4_UNCTE|nr:hypothetical protein [Candidatus Tectomicrobia bacterium]
MLGRWVMVCTLFLLLAPSFYALRKTAASEKSPEEIYKEFGVQKFIVTVKAPAFIMKNLEGQEIKSQDLLGNVVLLTFFTAD